MKPAPPDDRAGAPGWSYEPAADLDQSVVERLRRFPREPDMLVHGARLAAAVAVRTWLRFCHRFSITGREHLPAARSFVLVANHSSHLDAVCLQAALPLAKLHRAFSAAACDYFFESLPLTCLATVVANALPFSREVHLRQSLALCAGLLRTPGHVLILFPEGTRTTTGALGRFKPGIGALLAGTDIPAVPCHLDGAFRAFPKGAAFPRPARITLHLGPPRTYAHLSAGKTGALAVAADLEAAVRTLAPSP